MKSRVGFYSLALLIAGTSAAAQGTRTYSCSASDESFRIMIGPGEMQRFVDGRWQDNFCTYRDVVCEFQGAKFVSTAGGQPMFSLDTSTGAFFEVGDPLDDEDHDRTGTCQAE
jgi:hypothetical protein